MTPICDLLKNCRKYGDRPALTIGDRHLSYADLGDAIAEQARQLASRMQPGDRLALLCSNSLEFVTLSLAAESIGVIRVPLNIKSTAAEIAMLLEDCDPARVVFEEWRLAHTLGEFRHWLEDGAPSADASRDTDRR